MGVPVTSRGRPDDHPRPYGYDSDDISAPDDSPEDKRKARLAALPALVRAFLDKQYRCSGVFDYHWFRKNGSHDNLPKSPCYQIESDKIATHHEPRHETPDLCDECAAWNDEHNGPHDHMSHPRPDLAELRALLAAIEGM